MGIPRHLVELVAGLYNNQLSAAFSWLPRMLHAKISASLELFFRTCFLYLQYSAPSRLLLSSAALVFFFLLLQNSSFFRAGRRLLSSEPKAWLVSMRHAPPFIRFQGSPGSPTGSPGSPGSLAGTGLILELYHGTIIPEILHSFSIYLDVLTGLMWTTTPRTINN